MKEIEVVCAVIKKDDTYLIAQRAKGIGEYMWEFPGGKVEEKETQIDACIREIKEELELDIQVDQFICDVVDASFSPVVHVYAYQAHIVHGEMKLHDHYKVCWVKSEDFTKYTFQDADCEILERIKTQDFPES